MGSLPVIEHFDVVKGSRTGFFSRGKSLVVNEFILEIAEEALDHGIVVAIAFAAHADLGADLKQFGLVIGPDVGRAAITVTDEPGVRWAQVESHLQRFQAQDLAALVAHRPPTDPPREEIE